MVAVTMTFIVIVQNYCVLVTVPSPCSPCNGELPCILMHATTPLVCVGQAKGEDRQSGFCGDGQTTRLLITG